MPSLRRFLSYSYFPEELPQPFSSVSFGIALTRRAVALPPEFLPDRKGKYGKKALCATHNLARVGQLRRVLGIPNPVLFYNLARTIVDDWAEIDQLIQKSPFTVTQPIVPRSRSAKAIVPRTSPPDLPLVRSDKRSTGRYLLQADIQQFFPSIYTHSLAWAVNGKSTIKAHPQDLKLLGNKLDFWTRTGQDRQTRGIPIGPDTSRVLAEVLLAAVDLELAGEIGKLRGFRAIDDYELVFTTLAQAERALAALHGTLARYELTLNEAKTKIIEMPAALDEPWPPRLRSFPIGRSRNRQAHSMLDFFSMAFDLTRENRQAPILRYAVSKTSSIEVHRNAWHVYQNLMLQCAASEPGTLPHVTAELKKYARAGYPIDCDRVQETVSMLIERHTPIGHGSEVAWAIWLSNTLDVALTEAAIKLLPIGDDPLVPLLALHSHSKGLCPSLDLSTWESLMETQQLWGEHWLLAYEANVKGWLPSHSESDHVDSDPCFAFLKTQNVSFYNTRAAVAAPTRWKRRVSPITGKPVSP